MSEKNDRIQDWKAEKEAERKELLGRVSTCAKEVTQSPARFKNYLKLQGIFDRYSVANVLLINNQKPGATRLKDFEGWAAENRRILKGEKGISILHPKTYTRADGTEGVSYEVKKLFDITQVSGIREGGFPPGANRIADILIQTAPYDVREVDRLDFDNNGVYYNDQQGCLYIVAREKTREQFCQFLTLEIAYAQVVSEYPSMDPDSANFMAKCVACSVCSKFGQKITYFEFDDLPDNWRDLEPKEIRKQLDMIRSSSNRIIARASEELYHKVQKQEISL